MNDGHDERRQVDAARAALPPSRLEAGSQPRRRRLRRRGRLLLAALLVLLAAGTAWGWLRSQPGGSRGAAATLAKAVTGDLPPVSVLVLGVQQAQNLHQPPLTDSILLARIDPASRRAALLSIPRDLWVAIPGHGHGRINSAYELGGPALVEEVVAQLTGIRPDYFLVIDYDGFRRLIDDVGGVTVDVPRTLDDPAFPAPDMVHYQHLVIPKGVQHMDGQLALAYVRERHADPLGDLGRAQRQQQLLLALKQQFLRVQNLPRIPRILRDLGQTIRTDFPLSQVPGYAAALEALPQERIASGLLDYAHGAVSNWVTPGGADVLLPHPDAIQRLVAQVFAGTGVEGLPGETAGQRDGSSGTGGNTSNSN
ncbi:MAG: LCP family protein [Bacillota bacterium]|nr:LCP family protein [Bacillota bacterium]